ncbi:MAG: hypothetical protein ACXAC2_11240 [Candidatus Kariarchaeaceae archaeon]|jgi:hypothetical protein
MSDTKIQHTSFKCKLCKKPVSFHITDPDSYIALSDEKEFGGMALGTYRVGHHFENEYHVNVVTVDHKGHWRAFVDSYIDEGAGKKEVLFSLSDIDTKVLEPSDDLEFLTILDMYEGWVFDIICPTRLLPVEIAKDIVKNFDALDEEIIQEGMLFNLDIAIGLESFSCTKLGNMLIISIIKNQESVDILNALFEKLLSLNFSESKQILNRDSFKLIFEIMSRSDFNKGKIPSLIRLIEDGPKTNPANVHDFGTIPDLINKVINQKSYPEHLIIGMISLLSGQNTLNELLNQGYLKNYEDIIDIIDFIRVKLLTDEYLDYPEESDRVDKPVLINGSIQPDVDLDRARKIVKPAEMDTLFEDLPPLELDEKKDVKPDIIIPQKTVEKPKFEPFPDLEINDKQATEAPSNSYEETDSRSQLESGSSVITPDATAIDTKSDASDVSSPPVTSFDTKMEATLNEPGEKLAEILEKRKGQKSITSEEESKILETDKETQDKVLDIVESSKSAEKKDDDLFNDIDDFKVDSDEIEETKSETIGDLTNDQKSKLAEIAERRKKQREQRDQE